MKTSTTPATAPTWYILDASERTIGDIATRVVHVLRGKHKPSFSPHQLCGDAVIIINASKLSLGQKKLLQKEYFFHSGYFGHTKSTRLEDLFQKHPERVIERAIKGMLPRNRLRTQMLKRLHIFANAEHTHAPQKPVPFPL